MTEIQNVKARLEEQIELGCAQTGAVLAQNLKRAEEVAGVLATHIQNAETEVSTQKERFDGIIVGMNQELSRLESERQVFQNYTVSLEGILDAKFNDLEGKCKAAFEVQDQANERFKEWIGDAEGRILETGVAGGAGTGAFQNGAKLSTKGCRVERLSEKADHTEFRKWIKTIEIQLEHVFGKTHMEELILAIRHTKTPLAKDNWATIIDRLHEMPPHRFSTVEWDFDREGR